MYKDYQIQLPAVSIGNIRLVVHNFPINYGFIELVIFFVCLLDKGVSLRVRSVFTLPDRRYTQDYCIM